MAETTDKNDEKAKAPAESTFPRERLIAESVDFFGHEPHIVAGALALAKPANKAHFTRNEVQRLLGEWDKLSHNQALDAEE